MHPCARPTLPAVVLGCLIVAMADLPAAPTLWMTVHSVIQPAGEDRARPDPKSPQPCVILSGAQHDTGWPTMDLNVTRADLEGAMVQSLTDAGLPPAQDGKTPALAIVYHWGLHPLPQQYGGEEQAMRNVLERATLAGGRAFAHELQAAIHESAVHSVTNTQGINGTGGNAAFSIAAVSSMADPVANFGKRSARHLFLLDQSTSECFFIVVSAMAIDPATGERGDLLWRTSGTIRSRRLAAKSALPPLFAAMSPYLGQSKPEAALIKQKLAVRK